MTFQNLEIPRHPRYGGPLVIPPGKKLKPGNHKCSQCGRMVAPSGRKAKGTCSCEYYRRTTTFIDVLQDEFNLKAWDRRMVAYGMSQRPDLVLAASAVRPDGHPDRTDQDKRKLQQIADDAKAFAKAGAAATVGTSLHTLTQWMDTGQELGAVPDSYRADLVAYEQVTKEIEWVDVESFRVYDDWKVGGTTDRIGWYRGSLHIFDIKTGQKIWFPGTPAMQLGMYSRSKKYDIATDTRVEDVADLNLNTGYIIHLPAGSGHCELMPVDIVKGWGGCTIAKKVWDFRSQNFDGFEPKSDRGSWHDIVARASSVTELRMLWRNASDSQMLTTDLKERMNKRREQLLALEQEAKDA